jgi:vancomycin resistance protein YoaR
VAEQQVAVQVPEAPQRRRGAWTRRGVWVPLALLLLALVGYLALAAWTSSRAAAQATVRGVDVGGQSQQEARATIERELTAASSEPIDVVVAGAQDRLDPQQLGLLVDTDATVERLFGFSLDPRIVWSHITGGGEIDAVTTVDESAVREGLAELADRVDTAPVEGAVSLATGTPVVTAAMPGRALEVDAAADVLEEEWLSGGRPLELPAQAPEPAVDAADVESAMTSFATPALSGPLTVLVADRTVVLPPPAFAPALRLDAADGALVPAADGEALRAAVVAADPATETPPQDARIELQNGAPVVVPAVTGITVDAAALGPAAVAALTAPERTVTATAAVTEPAFTTAAAEALRVVEPISEFATTHTDNSARTENLRIAAATVSGTLLKPGETFSLNGVLGERTTAKGYRPAGAISDGVFVDQVGGGVSQMATTLFNGMFFAGLKDVEHKPHSLYISRYPEGREATVNYNNVDLKFTNDSQYGVLIEAWVGGGQVHTRFWGTKVWDITTTKGPRHNFRSPTTSTSTDPDCTSQSPAQGWDVDVTRTFNQGGVAVRTETFSTVYSAQRGIVCA